MSFDPTMLTEFAPYGILGFFIIALTVWTISLDRRLKKLLYGKNARTLEDSLTTIQKDMHQLIMGHKDTQKILTNHEERIQRGIRGVEVIRFNPFKGTSGSNQSFSAALLDEAGNGAVISTLYSREHVSTFAKPIKHGTSEYELTPEEKQAISRVTTREINSPNS